MSCIKGKSVDESASILCLNDDCLENIFKYLQLKDQMNLVSSCMRFRDIFVMFSKIKYQIVDFDEIRSVRLRPMELQEFFALAGPNIKDLHTYCDITQICGLLGFYCTNLKSMQHVKASLPNLKKLLHKPLLEKLKFNSVDLGDISIFKNLPKLKRLTLERSKITENSIKGLKNIEELYLIDTNITCNAFTKICEHLKELKMLAISEILQLEKSSLIEAVKQLNKLEALQIGRSIKYIECFAQIPNLIELWINDCPSNFFEVLVKYKKNQLQKLYMFTSSMTSREAFFIGQLKKLETLHCPSAPYLQTLDGRCLKELAKLNNLQDVNLSGCRKFENEDLLNLIKSCRRLHRVGIERCQQINNAFAKEVLKLLLSRKNQQVGVFLISAYWSGINPDFVKTSEFESANELLKFKFGPESEYDEEYTESIYNEDYFASEYDVEYSERECSDSE